MSPQLILEQAVQKKLNFISIVDHNTVQHSVLACKLSKDMPIQVLPGVELTTREEVHLLAYFSDIEALLKLKNVIDGHLPKEKNNPNVFGYQIYYDIKGEIVAIDNALRQNALNLGLDSLVDCIHDIGGIAIPGHLDRSKFSLLSQLGFLDPEARFDGVEISKFKWRKEKFQLGDTWDGFPVIAGSDSHSIEDIGLFFIEDLGGEIKNFLSLKNYLKRNRQ